MADRFSDEEKKKLAAEVNALNSAMLELESALALATEEGAVARIEFELKKLRAQIVKHSRRRLQFFIRNPGDVDLSEIDSTFGLGEPPIVAIVDSGVSPEDLADFFAELSSVYAEISGGDELVIAEGKLPVGEAVLS